jgi:hypothetical protein
MELKRRISGVGSSLKPIKPAKTWLVSFIEFLPFVGLLSVPKWNAKCSKMLLGITIFPTLALQYHFYSLRTSKI